MRASEGYRADQHPGGDSLYPQVALSSAKVLYGKPIKGQPIPIAKVTPDAGNVTIWGEVFAAEQRKPGIAAKNLFDQCDGLHRVADLKIMRLKICANPSIPFPKGYCLLIRGEVSYDKYDRK